MDIGAIKQRLLAEVERRADLLLAVSHELHAHPELGYEEHRAHALLSDILERNGLAVTRGAYDLPTAFDARAGREGPTVAVLCEYDALPTIGHACGHNIIAAAGLGAGLVTAALADELGGRLAVLGTPAEEGGGGKVFMAERGAFADVAAALMVHPAGAELRTMNTLAVHQIKVRYEGKAAHAASAPWAGKNALDAAVLGYVNVAALRQHIRPDERAHGIFTDAGERPNVVPAHAEAHWYVRSGTRARLEQLKSRVLGCLAAGADAAGCAMHHEWLDPAYDEMIDNQPLLDRYVANARLVGREPLAPTPETEVTGSTDMGNVSQAIPAIHPMVQAAPGGVAIHTAEFTTHTASALGDRAVIDGAKILALTVVDLWLDASAREAIAAAHAARTNP